MGVEDRPYVGTWRLGRQKLVQMTPDALVYINGDITLPGCAKCNSRINLQQFITEVSVDAGCDAAGSSASFSLSIPVHHLDSFARDARSILRPGLEVHIYERGYFPVSGLFSNLDAPQMNADLGVTVASEVQPVISTTGAPVVESVSPAIQVSPSAVVTADSIQYDYGTKKGGTVSWRANNPGNIIYSKRWAYSLGAFSDVYLDMGDGRKFLIFPSEKAGVAGIKRNLRGGYGNKTLVEAMAIWAPASDARNDPAVYARKVSEAVGVPSSTKVKDLTPDQLDLMAAEIQRVEGWRPGTFIPPEPDQITRLDAPPDTTSIPFPQERTPAQLAGFDDPLGVLTPPSLIAGGGPLSSEENLVEITFTEAEGLVLEPPPKQASVLKSSALEQLGLYGYDIESVLAYPYYQVFHGVVTNVGFQYSGGTQHATVQCASMLHFWQYHRMSSSGSFLGQRPFNSGNRMTLAGHNFTGMHPYEIIYALHYDSVGAANGVAWVLAQKTNQDARSGRNGEDLYSLTVKYWERRFNTRQNKLRLHGVTGEMFNAAQAAFLSTLDTDELMVLLRGRWGSVKGQVPKVLQQARSLGLFRKRKLDALLYLDRTGADKPTEFEMSLPEIQAYATNLTQLGNPAIFESTYETKLDIANRVCELTGFEFYQDVGGDFVFKPPMYNLDTSSSRVYRIEDIDILSINFDEQEPQATYISGKGSFIENVGGTGVENEFGVAGQYIDFRLVAQYGWRPADFESAYFTDAKAVYYAGVNRLDILNAPCRKATLTIPLRPELRQGYPVYIPYLDCFYYCNGFSHSYSVGGQCTTTLQLIARRAKFYAPGEVGKTGIEAIHLGYTALPEHPLEVLDEAGRPRLSGFPNVVMALDPRQINPAFLVAGNDVENLNTPEALTSLLNMAVLFGVVTNVPDASGQPGPTYTMAQDGNRDIVFYFSPSSNLTAKEAGMPDALDLQGLAQKYSEKLGAFGERRRDLESQVTALQGSLADALTYRIQLDKVRDPAAVEAQSKKIRGLKDRIDKANSQLSVAQAEFEKSLVADTASGMAFLMTLIRRTGSGFYKTGQPGGGEGDPNSTMVLLDLMSNKKSLFTNGSVPGSYRYYSASHPLEDQQGPPELTIDLTGNGDKFQYADAELEAAYRDRPIQGFVPTSQINMPSGARKPEAQLAEVRPLRGIKVYTNNPKAPNGEVLPTSEIREMSFSPVTYKLKTKKADTKPEQKVDDLTKGFAAALQKSAGAKVGTPSQSSTIANAMNPWQTTAASNVQRAAAAAKLKLDQAVRDKAPPMGALTAPEAVPVKGYLFATNRPIGTTYQFSGTSGTETSYAGAQNVPLPTFFKEMSQNYALITYRGINSLMRDWWTAASDAGLTFAERNQYKSQFNEVLTGMYAAAVKKGAKKKETAKPTVVSETSTVVFPVSDARGYEVFGTFRYGRDVDIDPNGVFDALHRQDPLAMLDRQTVEDILRVVVKHETIYVEELVSGPNEPARYQMVPKSGKAATTYLEQKMLESLREHMSDAQIIDLGLAKPGKDPNVLETNLMNWFAEKGSDGIQKLPLVNAAFSLGDLASTFTKAVCNCKAAEASVLLESAGQQDFVQFVQPGTQSPVADRPTNLDQTTQWLITTTAQAAVSWKVSQDAMRGSLPDQKPTHLIQAFQGAKDSFDNYARALEDRARGIQAAGAQVNRAGTRITSGEEE